MGFLSSLFGRAGRFGMPPILERGLRSRLNEEEVGFVEAFFRSTNALEAWQSYRAGMPGKGIEGEIVSFALFLHDINRRIQEEIEKSPTGYRGESNELLFVMEGVYRVCLKLSPSMWMANVSLSFLLAGVGRRGEAEEHATIGLRGMDTFTKGMSAILDKSVFDPANPEVVEMHARLCSLARGGRIAFRCPTCGVLLSAKGGQLGRTKPCPRCGSSVRVPTKSPTGKGT